MTCVAVTRLDVPVPKAPFPTRKEAIAWVMEHGRRYGVDRIVQRTKRGPRTVWRQSVADAERSEVTATGAQVSPGNSSNQAASLNE